MSIDLGSVVVWHGRVLAGYGLGRLNASTSSSGASIGMDTGPVDHRCRDRSGLKEANRAVETMGAAGIDSPRRWAISGETPLRSG